MVIRIALKGEIVDGVEVVHRANIGSSLLRMTGMVFKKATKRQAPHGIISICRVGKDVYGTNSPKLGARRKLP